VFALNRYGHFMDVYEQGILLAAVPTFAALGWHWKPVRWLMPLVACCRCGPFMYAGQLDNGSKKFWLRMMLSSQSAICG
jgi:hypothetical protein